MATLDALPRAFAVRFKDLNRWDASSFHRIVWHWPPDVMKPIGSVLTVRKEKVDRTRFKFSDLTPITIHFDGSIEKRKIAGNREYSMELFFAQPGDVVVAKIDLKNGAVAIIPAGWQNVVVTGHFAVYKPDLTKLVPEYLHRIVQSDFFKAHLWRNKVGAEGRKEVKLDFLEAEKIPLPDISVQQAILDNWQEEQQQAAVARQQVAAVQRAVDKRFYADLGLDLPQTPTLPKTFAVKWSQFLRWSVSYNQRAQTTGNLQSGTYPVTALAEILDVVQYGTSQKANTKGSGVPVIRMNNVVDGVLNLSKLKHVELDVREAKSLQLLDGDILINRTNSKELVGKCAVFHEPGVYVFASYLIRLRPNPKLADPDYLAYCINSPIGRQQIDAISRQIIGQANINTEELRSFRVPLPPLDVQRMIVRRIEDGREKVRAVRVDALRAADKAKSELGAMILGTRAVA